MFYRNPRLLVLTVCLILVAGISSFLVLPRMEDPLLRERAANVFTAFPGADAERVEVLVTEKLEDALREIEDIKEIRSSSRAGISTIAIELRDDVYEVDSVWSRIRDKLDDATAELPAGAAEPQFEQLDIKAYAQILALTWEGDSPVNYAILRRWAEDLKEALKALPGTEEVDLFGDPDEEIVVQIPPERLAALGVTAAELAAQIESSDAKVSAGQYRGATGELLLEVDGELDTLGRIASIPIRDAGGSRFLQLGDLATIDKAVQDPPRSLAVIEGRPAVVLGVLLRSDYRIDRWTSRADAELEEFSALLPGGVGLSTVFEQNRYVADRLTSLLTNLLLGGLAVLVVVFVLMGIRNAVIVGIALPLSALMVLAGMRWLNIPIHQMSVTGLIIALGLLIDNAIVMVDEVSEHLRQGVPGGEAVRRSVRHLAVPLVASTVTTALAFGPIALMPGPAGEFVGSIAVSVILAIGSSLILALTVVPALTALWGERQRSRRESNALGRHASHWWQEGVTSRGGLSAYRWTLDRIFARPVLGLALGLALPILGFVQARSLTEQFFPPADRDQIQIELELPAQAALAETLDLANRVRELALRHPEIEQVHWFAGESAPPFYYNVIPRRKNSARYAQALVQLNEPRNVVDLIHELQAELDLRFPAARAVVRQLEQGPPFDAPIEIRLFGPDLARLQELGDTFREVLASTPHVVHTRAELSEPLPKLALQVDEEQARLAGLDHAGIARQLHATLEGAVGGSILETTEELPVRVRVGKAERGDLDRIASLDLTPVSQPAADSESRIPLSALASLELKPEIAAVPRLNGRRMNEVQAYVTAGVLPAQVLADFRQAWDESGVELPPGYSWALGGETAKRDDAIGNLMANVGVLLVLMVATLVLSMGSFRVAGMVAAVAGLSVGLGLGALALCGYPFGFMAIVGTMGLIGVAINDTIVVLAGLSSDPAARAGQPAAVREVVVRATRHVVATSLTTMVGFAPLVVGGGGFWPPLAVAIAGGVGGATILALYFVPSAYLLLMGRQPKAELERTGQRALAANMEAMEGARSIST